MSDKEYDAVRKRVDRGIDRNLPQLSHSDRAIAYLGLACIDCGEIYDYPTRLNRLNERDLLGIEWARTNAVSQITRHYIEKAHWGTAYRINKQTIKYDD